MERIKEVNEIYVRLLNRKPNKEELSFFQENPYDKRKIEIIIKRSMEYYDKTLKDLREEKYKSNNNVIIQTNKSPGGLETHSKYLKKKIGGSIYTYDTPQILKEVVSKYKNIIWQNNFIKFPKKGSQKYIYYVHTQAYNWTEENITHLEENFNHIDIFIFVSKSVRDNFFKRVKKVDNYFVIENEVPVIYNEKKEIKNLFYVPEEVTVRRTKQGWVDQVNAKKFIQIINKYEG